MPSKPRKAGVNPPVISGEALAKAFWDRIFPSGLSPIGQEFCGPFFVAVVKALKSGDVLDALVQAHAVGRIRGQVEQQGRDFADVCAIRRQRAMKQQHDLAVNAASWDKVRMAAQLWVEYDATDLKRKGKKGGKMIAYKEIGEIMAQRLDLPKPIPAATVRDYLQRWKIATGRAEQLMQDRLQRKKLWKVDLPHSKPRIRLGG
jgi:hypothetical protein